MHKKGFLIILAILLIAPGLMTAQDFDAQPEKTIKTGIRPGKAYPIESGSMSVQALKQDKARVVLMGTSIFAHFLSIDEWYMQHIIPVNQVDILEIDVDFSAVLNTKIKFHIIFSGPEYYAYDDPDSYPAKYNTASYEDNIFWVQIDPSEWKKGTYKIVVIAEQETVGSGAESVITCIYRII